MKLSNSQKIWKKSQQYLAGGVNSPVRAFKSVGNHPIAVKKGKKCFIYDEDDNRYLDFLNSWGPLILGHAHPDVEDAIKKQAARGTSFGTITRLETQMAELICENIDHVDSIRFVSSGTEAVMSALRPARGYTGRDKILKFSGCYHGHWDGLLVSAGSGLLTFSGDISEASSPGVPASLAADTIVLPLDDEKLVEEAFQKLGNQIAAVIIEPLPANSGLLKQRIEFLQLLRTLSSQHGSLLIFDEVISGFRLGFAGFSGKYNLQPDLVTYGKIIGGGLPVGAFGGKKEIMQKLSPEGQVYQAGTLSGNPLAMRAGLAVLKKLHKGKAYAKLQKLAEYLQKQFINVIVPLFDGKGFQIHLVQEDSIFWLNITDKQTSGPLHQVEKIYDKAPEIYQKIFWQMIDAGIYIAPAAYEVAFLSTAMKKKHIDMYINALKKAIKNI